eukprot:313560_1
MANRLDFYWDWGLIVLSYVNACLGACLGVFIFRDSRQYTRNLSYFISLILLAAFGFGVCGIWCMHYVGMMAYRFVNISVSYNLPLVIASAAIAIALVSISFFYVGYNIPFGDISTHDLSTLRHSIWNIRFESPKSRHIWHCLIGGLIMGTGVASMHYTGMAAVQICATQQWIPSIIVLSVIIAIIVSFVGLLLLICIKGIYGQALASIIIGLAVCSMHYTGMYAVEYYENEDSVMIMHENNKQTGLIFNAKIISVISASIVAIILILYHILKFYRHRHKNFYKKRHGNVVIIVNIFSLLYIICGTVRIAFYDEAQLHYCGDWIHCFIDILLSFAFYGFLAMLLLRYVLSWYSISILWMNERLSWQKTLNADIESQELDHCYGDMKWLLPRICSVYGLFLVVDSIGSMEAHQVSQIVWLTVTLCTLIAIIFIYKKTPSSVNDLLYIFWEMKFIIIILSLMVTLTSIRFFAFFETWLSVEIFFIFQNMIGLTVMAIVPIEIILHYYRKMDDELSGHIKDDLAKFLRKMTNFQKFAKHLNQECCMECLLFLVETTQWKQRLKTLLQPPHPHLQHPTQVVSASEDASLTDLDMYIELPDGLPDSKIVFPHEDEKSTSYSDVDHVVQQFKHSAYLLYQKYIKEGSMYEINISFYMRNTLISQMDDYNKWMRKNSINANDLMDIFNEAMNEMYYLMKPSYLRFQVDLEETDFDSAISTIRMQSVDRLNDNTFNL